MLALFKSLSKPSVSADAIWGVEKLVIFDSYTVWTKTHCNLLSCTSTKFHNEIGVTDFHFNK